MNYYKSDTYIDNIRKIANSVVNIQKLEGKSVLITGASGMIGSVMVDGLMCYSTRNNMNLHVFSLGRDRQKLEDRFKESPFGQPEYIEHDVKSDLSDLNEIFDYVIHAAGNSYPSAFYERPIDTIAGNVLGTLNMLEYVSDSKNTRMLYVSSGEVYSNIDGASVRSCYPNSKKTAESLCAAYIEEKRCDIVIGRVCHTFGPTAVESDNRATAQFFGNACKKKNILMKSDGSQVRSYNYVMDTVSALLTIMVNGDRGIAYDICSDKNVISIADLAKTIAKESGVKVNFDLKEANDQNSPIKEQILDPKELYGIGWKPDYSIEEGVSNTVKILEELEK
ncbi:MAG: NAD-dependent epimerase/dehydratase family protein [Lachnospiraceae bacterium]|nr:NAD-dependent epimerase/dehydratase family protein [Lachnospiraceae bacterium]